ncbi:MAG: hypothetical protein ACOCYZ_06265 [Halococcoides sp.]
MAIDWIARRLLDWIDMDDEEAAELLPGTLADSLPARAAENPVDSGRSGRTDATDATAVDEASDASAGPTSGEAPDEGPSRLRRFGPYLLGLGAALAAFVGVLGVVHVVRGWIEELQVGYTPMDPPAAETEGVADRPAPGGTVEADRPVPAGDRPVEPASAPREDEGSVLAALVGLGFHKLVDGLVSRPPAAEEGTTIPVETADD